MTIPPAELSRWIVRPQPRPAARLQLFCFPYAGGGASIYRTWPRDLPPWVEVLALQLPGRETRIGEPPFTQIGPLVQQLGALLRPQFGPSFAFFGHSMGALIAFELARWLRQAGGPQPIYLAVSGRSAPQLAPTRPPIADLPEPAFVRALQQMNGTPREVFEIAELRELLLPVLRADMAVVDHYTYTPDAPLACPIGVFGGSEDDRTTPEGLAAWQAQTHGSCQVNILPGDHFFLRSGQAHLLQVLGQALQRSL